MSHFQKNVDKIVKEMLLSNNNNNNTDNNDDQRNDQHINTVLKKNSLQTQIDSLVSKAKNKN